jgi:hypothetical protein
VILDMIAAGKLRVCPVHGRVWVFSQGRLIEAVGKDKDGYVRMRPMFCGSRYELRRCRVVWVYVNGATSLEIDHRNDRRDDDRIGNLFALTHFDNHWKMVDRQRALRDGDIPEDQMTEEELRKDEEPF